MMVIFKFNSSFVNYIQDSTLYNGTEMNAIRNNELISALIADEKEMPNEPGYRYTLQTTLSAFG
jgi:hypothetical protein